MKGASANFCRLSCSNALLNILTLGFYRFWARTRVRRFLWGNTALLGDRFEYTGTGAELFKGFIFVLFAVLLPITVTNIIAEFYFADNDIIYGVYNLALLVAIWFLIGVAIYRARRFRLSPHTMAGFAQPNRPRRRIRRPIPWLSFLKLADARLDLSADADPAYVPNDEPYMVWRSKVRIFREAADRYSNDSQSSA